MSDSKPDLYSPVGLTQALVRIPSQNPLQSEAACAAFVADWFRGLGVEPLVEDAVPGRPNVVVRLPGSSRGAPALAYLAHMDTVPAGDGWTVDPFGGEVDGGRLYGRGAADMKSGLAATMLALKRVLDNGIRPRRDFLVCATVDEEGAQMYGAVRLVEQGLLSKDTLLVASEPTGLDLVVAQKGVMWYRVDTYGKMAHAGTPEVGADAMHGLAEVVVALKQAFAELPYDHPILGRASVTIGQAAAGRKTNVVPDHAWAEIDTRLVPPLATAEATALVRAVVQEAAARVPGVKGTVEVVTINRPPVELHADSPLSQAFDEVCRAVVGRPVRRSGFPAYTDAAIAAAMTGNPNCALFGPGHLRQAHTTDEYVPVAEIALAVEVLSRVAELLLTS
ncbi:MAG: M20 family metallopeptidase [Chloroflexi bacterium]|nr:M20 family metallopeptidase [Chloroflexota bacterium]